MLEPLGGRAAQHVLPSYPELERAVYTLGRLAALVEYAIGRPLPTHVTSPRAGIVYLMRLYQVPDIDRARRAAVDARVREFMAQIAADADVLEREALPLSHYSRYHIGYYHQLAELPD